MEKQKVLVTGSEGMIGRVVVQELDAAGYQVTPVDKITSRNLRTKVVDCEDLGQVIRAMSGHAAVIHLAAIANPDRYPAEIVYRNNVMSNYIVLEAAAFLGIKKVVMASSISALGIAFAIRHFNPQCVPIDEAHPLLSQDAYGLSKMTGELLAEGFHRRQPDLTLVSLRFAFVVSDETRAGYLNTLKTQQQLSDSLASVFWTYTDVRDAAASCRLALQYSHPGHEPFYINAPHIIGDDPIEALLARYYPGDYPVAAHIRGSASPIDCSKAKRLLGWKAAYHWQGHSL